MPLAKLRPGQQEQIGLYLEHLVANKNKVRPNFDKQWEHENPEQYDRYRDAVYFGGRRPRGSDPIEHIRLFAKKAPKDFLEIADHAKGLFLQMYKGKYKGKDWVGAGYGSEATKLKASRGNGRRYPAQALGTARLR